MGILRVFHHDPARGLCVPDKGVHGFNIFLNPVGSHCIKGAWDGIIYKQNMRVRSSFVGLLLGSTLCLLWLGCSKDGSRRSISSGSGTNPVARIGSKEIFASQLANYFDSRLRELADDANVNNIKSKLFEDFLEEQLLLSEAEKLRIAVSQDEIKTSLARFSTEPMSLKDNSGGLDQDASFIQSMVTRLKIEKYLRDHVLKDISVSKEEVLKRYQAAIEGGSKQEETVHVFEILVSSANLAQKIYKLTLSPLKDNFTELAKMYSISSSAARGGDLGYFRRGELPEEFEKVIFALKPGYPSNIVKTQYGYHIFLVKRRLQGKPNGFDEIKEDLLDKILAEKQQGAILRKLSDLKSQTKIKIFRDNLNFAYVAQKS